MDNSVFNPENKELYDLCYKFALRINNHETITQIAILEMYDSIMLLMKRSGDTQAKSLLSEAYISCQTLIMDNSLTLRIQNFIKDH